MNSGVQQTRLLSPRMLLFQRERKILQEILHARAMITRYPRSAQTRTAAFDLDQGFCDSHTARPEPCQVLSNVVLHVASGHAVCTRDDACRSALQLLLRSAVTAGNCSPGFRSSCGAPSYLHGTAPQRTRSLHCNGQDGCRRDSETRKAQNILQAYAKDNKIFRTRSR